MADRSSSQRQRPNIDIALAKIRQLRFELRRHLAGRCCDPDEVLDAMLELDALEQLWLERAGTDPF